MSLVRQDIDGIGSITKALGPVSIATNTNTLSASISLSAYPGWRVMLIGASGTRTDGTYTFSVQQSATSGGSYAAVTPLSGSVAAVSAADTTVTASFAPTLPFIKVNILSASTTTGALLTAFIVLLPPAV